MKNGENFNSAPDASKSFEDAYGSWDVLREELNQKQEAKAEADALKKREEELKKGAKKFDKSVRDAIHKGDKVAFDEMMERDEHYRQMENGENRVESEQPYEISTLSKEEMDQAVGASLEIKRMNSLAKMIQNAESEEVKNKYRQQLIEASNDFSKNGVNFDGLNNKLEDRFIWEYSKKPEYRQKVLDTIWENAMAEPVVKDSGEKNNAQVQIEQPSNEKKESKKDSIELSDAEFTFGKQKRADRAKNVVDQDDNIEAKAGQSREFMKRAGKAVLGIMALVGFGAISFVAGRRSAEPVHVNNSEPKVEDNTRTELSESSASEFNKLANFDNSNAQEQEKNFNNGKYDSENDDYNNIDQKESKYSIGTDTSKLSNEEYQKKMIESHNEDNIEYMGQFFVNDAESAQNLLGISNTEVDDLVDAARNGDQTAFKKMNDAYSKYMEGAKVVGNQTLDGDYYSLFVNSNKDYAHAEGAFGGTARIVELKNGQQILIRDQCKQMVMKKIAEIPNTWTTPVIPFEEAYTPPAPNTENPPAPTPETPPETPPTTPETPPQELEAKDPTKDINVNANLNPEAKVDGQKFEVNTNEGNQQDEIQEVPNVYEAPAAQPDLNIQPSVDLANETVVGQGNVEVTPQYRADGWINDTTSQTWESAYNNGGTQVEAQEGTNGSAGINTGRVE